MLVLTFVKGFILSFSLIVAIGAQNIFVLKQGIAQSNVFIVCFICFLCDVVLMNIGIFGVGEILATNKIANLTITILGILFLIYYGFLSLKSAFSIKNTLDLKINKISVKKSLILTLGVTLLNPQVYLDTVFIVGAAALTLEVTEKIFFSFGALCSSFIWFFSLGFGAKRLSKWLQKPKIAMCVDVIIAFIMFLIAFSLLKFAISSNLI
ncbi:LysE/ArgO family amino acid transporter [Campylobacter geochelonis]|uniref:CmeB n=1 Tax=Campylobacter geochelonis TaxID=1780362 RepID=A0A128EL53_9BACT|nr:LysE/ArgO family amino acid transporter [Campylobacter geochelonis]QKF71390.1 transporter, LysE family [Campylobacter geochelonis]CZE49486.1 CmeB [Campylobacter geochelonis]